MLFFLENTNIWKKSQDFRFSDFFIEIFNIYRLIWIFIKIFGCFEYVSSMFCLKGPKHEIFIAKFFTQFKPVWEDDLGTRK
jgi:hypothetical protein